jgi:two-component system cell cycle response regulator
MSILTHRVRPGPAAAVAKSSPKAGSRLDRISGAQLAAGAACWLALFAAATWVTRGEGTSGLVVVDLVYLMPHVLAVTLALRAARRTTGAYRKLWTMVGCALSLWLAGELIVSFYHVALGADPPFPGVADGFFLGFYVSLIITFVVALRPALRVQSWKAVLDASVLAVTVGYVGWTVVVEPQLAQPASLATVIGAAYPVLDVAMLTVLVSLMLASFRRPPLSLLILTAAIAIGGITDSVAGYISLNTISPELGWLKIGWETEAVLLVVAPLLAMRPKERLPSPAATDLRDRGLTLALAGVAVTLALVILDAVDSAISVSTGVIALYVVGALALRLHLTSRARDRFAGELEESLLEQRRIADTDELTGLHNRRYADRHLDEHVRAGSNDVMPETGLLILDLDHFKQINDRHGHPVGDDVLRMAAGRLGAAARPGDVVARYGGEEFMVILPGVQRTLLGEVAERFRASIAEQPFDIGDSQPIVLTASVGGASMPADAATLTELLRIADRALYSAKSMGRNRVQIGAHGDEGSIEALMERSTVLNFVQDLVDYVDAAHGAVDHGRDTARWAVLVADELDLDGSQRLRVAAAGRLHDIGKLGVPDEILATPRLLDEHGWEEVRRHPDIGADILAMAPGLDDVADVVRQHHEHYDGSGYPAKLAGEGICTEARVLAVCDTWVAMRSDRPYRKAMSEADALSELRRVAGAQLDPRVVAAFLRVYDRPQDDAATNAARAGLVAFPQ